MKTKPFLTTKSPDLFAPCDAYPVILTKSLKQHPSVLAIRNKRRRARMVKQWSRTGVTSYSEPGWEIHPDPR